MCNFHLEMMEIMQITKEQLFLICLEIWTPDLNSTAVLTIAENQPVGTIVGEFNAIDPENSITYHLVSGEGDGNTLLLEANGSLSTAVLFDYEADAPTYSIRVQAKDEYNATEELHRTPPGCLRAQPIHMSPIRQPEWK